MHGPRKERGKPREVCQKYLAGGHGHTGHLTAADNCVMFGFSNPTREEDDRILRLHEAALAKDDLVTRAAMDRGKSSTQEKRMKNQGKTLMVPSRPSGSQPQEKCNQIRAARQS